MKEHTFDVLNFDTIDAKLLKSDFMSKARMLNSLQTQGRHLSTEKEILLAKNDDVDESIV